jgi:hypothetical protein
VLNLQYAGESDEEVRMTVRSGAGTNMSAAARQDQLQQYPGHPAPQSGLRIGPQSFAVCIIVGKRTCWYCTVLYVVFFVYLEKHNVPWSGSVTSHVPSAVRSRTLGFRSDEGRAGFLHVPAVVCAQSDSAPYSSKMQRLVGERNLRDISHASSLFLARLRPITDVRCLARRAAFHDPRGGVQYIQ